MPYYKVIKTFNSLSEGKKYAIGSTVMLTKKKAEKYSVYLLEDKQHESTEKKIETK